MVGSGRRGRCPEICENKAMKKVILTSTVPLSLNTFCRGWFFTLRKEGCEVVAVSSAGSDLEEIGAREWVRTCAVEMDRRMSPFKDLRSLFGLIKVFRRERPYMVHSITPKAGLLAMMAAWMTGVPVRVHTFTGLVFPTEKGLKRFILKLTDSLTCFFATYVIPEGRGVKTDLERYGITKKPLRVLGAGNVRGIDLEYYNPENADVKDNSERLRKSDVLTFIFVGRLVGDKGINELVEAFGRLNREYPATRLLLVGWREDELNPLSRATEEAIDGNAAIEYVGCQKDVRPWMSASDILVFPSYREGFPNVVIEAGAMGLPSVVTDINGSNEIIINGENGIIVPPRDAESLYAAMKEMLVNPSERMRMASAARRLIAGRYEHTYVRECLGEFYREIWSA